MAWMHDPVTGLVLPPGAEPSTPPATRVNVAQLVKDDVRQLLTDILFDKVGHAMAVAAGLEHWRIVFGRQYGSVYDGNRAQCDSLAETLYRFITTQWSKRYPGVSATLFLDSVHIPSPQSEAEIQREIDDAWVLEIGGSEEAMRQHYEGSARVRTGKDLGAKRFD